MSSSGRSDKSTPEKKDKLSLGEQEAKNDQKAAETKEIIERAVRSPQMQDYATLLVIGLKQIQDKVPDGQTNFLNSMQLMQSKLSALYMSEGEKIKNKPIDPPGADQLNKLVETFVEYLRSKKWIGELDPTLKAQLGQLYLGIEALVGGAEDSVVSAAVKESNQLDVFLAESPEDFIMEHAGALQAKLTYLLPALMSEKSFDAILNEEKRDNLNFKGIEHYFKSQFGSGQMSTRLEEVLPGMKRNSFVDFFSKKFPNTIANEIREYRDAKNSEERCKKLGGMMHKVTQWSGTSDDAKTQAYAKELLKALSMELERQQALIITSACSTDLIAQKAQSVGMKKSEEKKDDVEVMDAEVEKDNGPKPGR